MTVLALAVVVLLQTPLHQRLASDDPDERLRTRDECAKMDRNGLKAKDRRSLLALGVQGHSPARDGLIDLTRDADETVRAAAFEALGGLRVDESVFTGAFTASPRVAFAAARGFARSRGKQAIPRLSQMVSQLAAQKRPDRAVILAAYVGLAEGGDPIAWYRFWEPLADAKGDPAIASAALIALTQTPPPADRRVDAAAVLRVACRRDDLAESDRVLAFGLWRRFGDIPADDVMALLRLNPLTFRRRVFDVLTAGEPSKDGVETWLAWLADAAIARDFGDAIEKLLAKTTAFEPKGDRAERIKAWREWWTKHALEAYAARVNRAIEKGIGYLRAELKAERVSAAELALVMYTIVVCGVGPSELDVASALEKMLERSLEKTDMAVYVSSLNAMLFAEVLPRLVDRKEFAERCEKRLREAAAYLQRTQNADGTWGYSHNNSRCDHSNTQFALVGLRAAQNAGVRVPEAVWSKAATYLAAAQWERGWGYTRGASPYASMTGASLCAWLTARASALGKDSKDVAGEKPSRDALAWLGENWNLKEDYGGYAFYRLWAIERACSLAAVAKLGEHDWYREGADWIMSVQLSGGTWSGRGLTNACFALLFLKRAYVPVKTPSAPAVPTGK